MFVSPIDNTPELLRLARRLMRQNRGAVGGSSFGTSFPFKHQTQRAKEEKACPQFRMALWHISEGPKNFMTSWPRDLLSVLGPTMLNSLQLRTTSKITLASAIVT